MENVESIYPYTIVKEDEFYGIADNKGNIVVPCVMDDILNFSVDEAGTEYWEDFSCVVLRKDFKYGFFTSNGTFIEPAYDFYALDPFSEDIHVSTNEGYGIFAAPEYVYEALTAEDSLLSTTAFDDLEEDDSEIDFHDFLAELREMCDEETQAPDKIDIENDVIDAVSERLHAFGYAFTQDFWNATYNENDQTNIEQLIDDALTKLNDFEFFRQQLGNIKAQGECDESKFWDLIENNDETNNALRWCINQAMRGAASFISIKSMAHANIPLFNSKISRYLKNIQDDGYRSLIHLIDSRLPRPQHGSFEYIPIEFPVDRRPACKFSFFGLNVDGEIGEIYLYEHSMHMFRVCVNVYDSEDPTELLEENHILETSDVVLSDLLSSLQAVIDPEGKDDELTAAIEKATLIENEKCCIAPILKECGIYMLSLSDFGRHPRFCDGDIISDVDYIYVVGDDVVLVMHSSMSRINIATLNERIVNYSWIVEDIKAAANMAYQRSKA